MIETFNAACQGLYLVVRFFLSIQCYLTKCSLYVIICFTNMLENWTSKCVFKVNLLLYKETINFAITFINSL